jgi:hypothetical protein
MATAADGHLSSAFVTLILNTEDWGFTREQCLFFRQILLLLDKKKTSWENFGIVFLKFDSFSFFLE